MLSSRLLWKDEGAISMPASCHKETLQPVVSYGRGVFLAELSMITRRKGKDMNNTTPYKARQFPLGGLTGSSDQTLEMHFKLYEGYVKETNQ